MPCVKNRPTNDRLDEVSAIRDGGRFPNAPSRARSWRQVMGSEKLRTGVGRPGGAPGHAVGAARGRFGEPTYLCRPTGYRAARNQMGTPVVEK